jgi:Flp pilus assembly protein CpaB
MKPRFKNIDGRLRLPDARVGVGVLLVAVSVLGGLRLSGASRSSISVFSAERALASGHRITESDLVLTSVSVEEGVQATLISGEDQRSLIGRVVARPVQAGSLLTRRDIGRANESLREITVPVAPEHALGGVAAAGDIVDVLATFDGGGDTARTIVVSSRAEVVSTLRPEQVFGGAGGATALTLAVPNDDAMFIVFAMRTGEIDILRSADLPSNRSRVDAAEIP